MSAQLLICKFAVFTCVSFFFTDASLDSHGSLARSLLSFSSRNWGVPYFNNSAVGGVL